MAVSSVNKVKVEQTWREFNKRETTVIYRVIFTVRTDDPDVALDATGIPGLGDYLVTSSGTDRSQRCKRKTAQHEDDESLTIVLVRVDYSTADARDNSDERDDDIQNPLKRRPKIRVTYTETAEDAYQVINDDGDVAENGDTDSWDGAALGAITNSAGQTFDPPVQREIFDTQIIIERNEPRGRIPVSRLEEYQGALNEDAWNGFDANTCKIRISKEDMYEAGFHFDKVTYDIRRRSDGWIRKVVDQGFVEATSGNSYAQETITDDGGIPMQQMVLLDGSGAALSDGATRQTGAVILKFQTDKRKKFSSLELPRVL